MSALIGYLFYNSLVAGMALCLFAWIYVKERYKGYVRRRKDKLANQFKDGMNAVSIALLAGYSIENAFCQAGREMIDLYGEKSDIAVFFWSIDRQIGINKNIEDVLKEYALLWDVEDITAFSEIFSYAKRSGGNMVEIITDTVNTITEKLDTAREISVIISAKQFEQYIMDAVPIFIILYLRWTSPDLICSLYGNLFGQIFMSISLCVYAISVLVSFKITNIKV